jgi:hypothetical protein
MKIFFMLSKVMTAITIIWAIAAAVYLLAFATATRESVEMSVPPNQPPITTRTVEQIPFVIYAGASGIVAVIIFSSLLVLGAVFALRASLVPAAIISALALAAVYISGFSIGGLYLPGAVSLCTSTLLAFVAARRHGLDGPIQL